MNPAMYFQALPLLFRHLSIVTAPLLAAVVSILLDQLSHLTTDAMGDLGAGLYTFIAQIVWLIAFGAAVIQAHNIWNGRDGSFDAAWTETRSKLGGIALAAVGFTFILSIAAQLGSLLGTGLTLLLELMAAFFLIYTIPAAAIGGAPAGYAISASYRAAVANLWPTAVLAIAYVVCAYIVTGLFSLQLYGRMPDIVADLVLAAIKALLLTYLAFAFAKQYDDVA